MSYILDALKKSEAERRQANPVSLLERENASPFISSRLVVALVGVLLINAAMLAGWLLWPKNAPDTSDQPTKVSARPELNLSNPVTHSKSDLPVTHLPKESVSVPVPMSELAPSDRAKLPSLDISTHIYASDADLRAIVVNGKRVQEGESIGPSLKLKEITEQGIIVEFHQKQIEIPFLQDW